MMMIMIIIIIIIIIIMINDNKPDPILLVMTTIAFLKSTFLPWLSVKCPSSIN